MKFGIESACVVQKYVYIKTDLFCTMKFGIESAVQKMCVKREYFCTVLCIRNNK